MLSQGMDIVMSVVCTSSKGSWPLICLISVDHELRTLAAENGESLKGFMKGSGQSPQQWGESRNGFRGRGSEGGAVVKNSPASVGDIRDVGSVPSWEDPLEEDMATHSSILAQRIPWTEESGRLQSIGSQRVRHD